MIQTRTQSIHRGFHRIGAVLAGLIFALGLIVVGVVAVEETQRVRPNASAAINKQPSYSLSQLNTALKNADAAGDIAAASRLALEIEKVRSTQSEASIPELKAMLESPAFVNGDPETRRSMFDENVASNSAYAMANAATQRAIRKKYGIENTSDQFDKPMSTDAPAQPSAGLRYWSAIAANIPLLLLAGFAAAAAAIYTMCRAVGWIIVGFAGD